MLTNALALRKRSCPDGCTKCVDACAQANHGLARITVAASPGQEQAVSFCRQCSEPDCVPACPSEAIARTRTGIVRIDPDECTGCGNCVESCSYQAITLDDSSGIAVKCELCGDNPPCVAACPQGVLHLLAAEKTERFLGEDVLSPGLSECAGCTVELAARFTLRVLGKDIVAFAAPGCCPLAGRSKIATYGCLMTNVSSSMSGMQSYLRRIGSTAKCVALVGDGLSSDVGFQPLSGAAERDEEILYICYDNEGYMNTGIQRSSTTPQWAWTTTTQVGSAARGKAQQPKNIPLIMLQHEIPYVATATLSHLDDYAEKLLKAKATKNGLAYIHLLTPCTTGWRFEPKLGIEYCRRAVETNYFPLWEAVDGSIRLAQTVASPQPIAVFLEGQKRFAHMTKEEIKIMQDKVDRHYAYLQERSLGGR